MAKPLTAAITARLAPSTAMMRRRWGTRSAAMPPARTNATSPALPAAATRDRSSGPPPRWITW